jgi:hypothetical protein
MPILALVLPFLKTWWKVLLPVVLLVAALVYVKVLHMEIDHYKAKTVTMQLAIDAAAVKEKALEVAAQQLTIKYKESLANQFALQDAQGQVIHERIKKNVEANRNHISPAIVELFNASKPALKLKDPAATIKGNDAGTGTHQKDSGQAGRPELLVDESPPQAYEHTLAELLDVSAYNDSNHAKCIATVHEWQHFWIDYTESYKAVNASP